MGKVFKMDYSIFGPDNLEIDQEYEELKSDDLELSQKAAESIKHRLRSAANLSLEWLIRTGFYEHYPIHPLLMEIASSTETLDPALADRVVQIGRPKENHAIRDRLVTVLMNHELLKGCSKVDASDVVSLIIECLPEVGSMSSGTVRNIHRRVGQEDSARAKAIEEIEK